MENDIDYFEENEAARQEAEAEFLGIGAWIEKITNRLNNNRLFDFAGGSYENNEI